MLTKEEILWNKQLLKQQQLKTSSTRAAATAAGVAGGGYVAAARAEHLSMCLDPCKSKTLVSLAIYRLAKLIVHPGLPDADLSKRRISQRHFAKELGEVISEILWKKTYMTNLVRKYPEVLNPCCNSDGSTTADACTAVRSYNENPLKLFLLTEGPDKDAAWYPNLFSLPFSMDGLSQTISCLSSNKECFLSTHSPESRHTYTIPSLRRELATLWLQTVPTLPLNSWYECKP
jgi:hypothetical protein